MLALSHFCTLLLRIDPSLSVQNKVVITFYLGKAVSITSSIEPPNYTTGLRFQEIVTFAATGEVDPYKPFVL